MKQLKKKKYIKKNLKMLGQRQKINLQLLKNFKNKKEISKIFNRTCHKF